MRAADAILIAAIGAGAILGAAYAASNRYVLATASEAGAMWKVDQWTGETFLCVAADTVMACIGPVANRPPPSK
jgi:hypothetical protein